MAFVVISVFLLLIAAPLVLARGALARDDIISAVCIGLLCAYVEAILWWPFYFGNGDVGASLFIAVIRPPETALVLVSAAMTVPLISVPSLALGTATGSLAAWPFWRHKRRRLAAVLWVLIVPVASWFAAEALVRAELRRAAAAQFPAGYCTVLSRLSVAQMIRQQTYEERFEHVILIADRADYYWSFRERRFLKRGHSNQGYECGRREL